MRNLSVIILTFNSETVIAETLLSALQVSDDVHVVDSFSSDTTVAIVSSLGARLIQHEFESYNAQRNWAIDNLPMKYDWQLHLDADERLSQDLIAEILRLEPPASIAGYFLPRKVIFMRRPIMHGGMYPIWHMRLFRSGAARCENRRYDQHFLLAGTAVKLNSPFLDDHRLPLTEWVSRHNRWAEAEVEEILHPIQEGVIQSDFNGSPLERKRAVKGWYYRLPQFVRAFGLFIYRYFLRFGFLDGKEGLIFFVLQTFWFRFLVDAKLFEKMHQINTKQINS